MKFFKGRGSLYRWYAKAVILKREDPELFYEIVELARPGIEQHGVDEESGSPLSYGNSIGMGWTEGCGGSAQERGVTA